MYKAIGSGIPTAAGGLTLLATATPSAATIVTFSSIPQLYKNLYLVWENVFGTLNAWSSIRLNDDTASHFFSGSPTLGSSVFGASGSVTWGFGDTTNPNFQGFGTLTVFDYSSSVDGKAVEWRANSSLNWGFYNKTTPVSRIDIIPSTNYSPFVVSGKFFLYGVA